MHLLHVSMHFLYVFLSLHLPFFFSFLHFLVEILSLQLVLWIVNSLSEIKTEKTSFRYYVFQDIVAKVIESVANIHSLFSIFSPCIVYRKVASRAQLVAEPIAEVFYYVDKVNFNYSVKNSTVDCKYLLFMSFQMIFLKNQLYWHFLYCFGFYLKKNLVEKVNIYNQQLNFWRNDWRLHNWCCRKPLLMIFKMSMKKKKMMLMYFDLLPKGSKIE